MQSTMGFMTAAQREPYAKEWLLEQVEKERDYIDFRITGTRQIIQITEQKSILFKFRCSYKERVHAILRTIERTFFVAFDYQDGVGRFMCPLL